MQMFLWFSQMSTIYLLESSNTNAKSLKSSSIELQKDLNSQGINVRETTFVDLQK